MEHLKQLKRRLDKDFHGLSRELQLDDQDQSELIAKAETVKAEASRMLANAKSRVLPMHTARRMSLDGSVASLA